MIGNERLVGSVGWHNVGRSFDAARVPLGGGETRWSGGAFLATVHEGNATYGHLNELGLDRDHWFTGALAGHGPLEVFALHDGNAHERMYSRINRSTLGGRLQAPGDGRRRGHEAPGNTRRVLADTHTFTGTTGEGVAGTPRS